MTTNAFLPSTPLAVAARNALSVPPEYATIAEDISPRIAFSFSSFSDEALLVSGFVFVAITYCSPVVDGIHRL